MLLLAVCANCKPFSLLLASSLWKWNR